MVSGWFLMALAAAPVQSLDGGLSLTQVQELVSWHSPEINACFVGAPKRASVRYRFVIEASGRVAQLGFLEAQKAESARITCVGAALEKWRFPVADAGAEAQWMFSVTSFDAGVRSEPVVLAPEEIPTSWVDDAAACYGSMREEGRMSLELVALPSGGVVEASASEISPALAETGLPACLQDKALAWSLPAASEVRRSRASWVFANSERRAKGLFVADSPAREVVSLQPPAPLKGGLDKDVIHKEITRNTRKIRACYELGLGRRHDLAGKLAVGFVIGPDGTVISSQVIEDTVRDADTSACVLDVVGRMKFPPPLGGGNVNVTFPWVFKSVEAEEWE